MMAIALTSCYSSWNNKRNPRCQNENFPSGISHFFDEFLTNCDKLGSTEKCTEILKTTSMSPAFLSRTRSWNPDIRPRQQNRIINNLESNFTMKKMSQFTISQLLAGYWNLLGKMGQVYSHKQSGYTIVSFAAVIRVVT